MEVITASHDYNFNHKRRRTTTEEEGWVQDRCGSCAREESHDYQLQLRSKTPHLAFPYPPRGGEKPSNKVEHHHLPPQLVEEPNPKRRRLLNTTITPHDQPEPPVAVAQPTPPHPDLTTPPPQYYEDIKDTAAHLFGPDDAAALWPSDSLAPQAEGSTMFWDEEAIFNMPHLMASMAEGLLIDPPPTATNLNDLDYDFSVSLWSWND